MTGLRTGRRRAGGHALIEMAIVVAVLGVLCLLAASDHLRQVPRYRLQRTTEQVGTALRAARMCAVSENRAVRVRFERDPARCAAWADRNTNGVVDAGEEDVVSLGSRSGLEVTAPAGDGWFDTRGAFLSSNGYWDVRFTVPGAGSRRVCLLPSGHVEWLRRSGDWGG